MKQSLPLILASVLLPLFLSAQPVITKDWVGKQGDIIVTAETEQRPDVTPEGENVTWDFSILTEEEGSTFMQQFVDPDTTQFADDYPDANTCYYSSINDPDVGLIQAYGYTYLDDTKWEVIANVISAGPVMITEIYSEPKTIIPFPLEYQQGGGSSFYKGENNFAGSISEFHGLSIVYGDAWGTVILPEATYENCIRMRVITSETDTTDLGGGVKSAYHVNSTTFTWLNLDHHGPLATYEESVSYQINIVPSFPNDTVGISRDTSMTWDPSAISSSVDYFASNELGLNVTPTLFDQQVTAEFNLEVSEQLRIELYNINGQQVYSTSVYGITGQNRVSLELPELASGSYVAMIRGKKQGGVVQLVKAN